MLDEAEIIEVENVASEPAPRERLRRLAARIPGVRVLANSPNGSGSLALEVEADDDAVVSWIAVADGDAQLDALRAGASGVISGSAGSSDLKAAVESVRHGQAVVPVGLLRGLLPAADGGAAGAAVTNGPSLTPREISVLQLLSEGATNKMIARRLDISVHTAKFHVASILDKLDATTRTDAVAQGVRQGVLML